MFERTVKRFQQTARHWARQILDDEDLIEDAVQEAFIAAYLNQHQLRQPDALAGWLKQIVLRQCYRIARREGLHIQSEAQTGISPNSTPDPTAAAEYRDLEAAIDALPPHQRDTLRLFYYQGYAHRDIARILNIPTGTVKKRLHDARQRLKGLLDDEGATL